MSDSTKFISTTYQSDTDTLWWNRKGEGNFRKNGTFWLASNREHKKLCFDSLLFTLKTHYFPPMVAAILFSTNILHMIFFAEVANIFLSSNCLLSWLICNLGFQSRIWIQTLVLSLFFSLFLSWISNERGLWTPGKKNLQLFFENAP